MEKYEELLKQKEEFTNYVLRCRRLAKALKDHLHAKLETQDLETKELLETWRTINRLEANLGVTRKLLTASKTSVRMAFDRVTEKLIDTIEYGEDAVADMKTALTVLKVKGGDPRDMLRLLQIRQARVISAKKWLRKYEKFRAETEDLYLEVRAEREARKSYTIEESEIF